MSVFLVATLFSWDCWLVTDEQPSTVAFVSHDDFVDVYLPDGRQLTGADFFKVATDPIPHP